ncbi:MAG: pirin family protein [Bacteroidia bacterium]|nr:pirin family protein [Bacteroidia bacterium]
MSNTVIHTAQSRGHANHGWLNSYHSFSFAGYYNPQRLHFGALRVLNDDEVAAGMGFGTHPHDNMEIISIPLEGDLLHKDNMGNSTVIKYGDVQLMSAGTGITHSEYNKNNDRPVKFLQIWIIPNQRNVSPRYDQMSLDPNDRHNTLQQIISPNKNDAGLWLHQNAWFHLSKLEKNVTLTYNLKDKNNGVYLFVLSGGLMANGQTLNTRDGFGIWNTDALILEATLETELLIMEVPMLN